MSWSSSVTRSARPSDLPISAVENDDLGQLDEVHDRQRQQPQRRRSEINVGRIPLTPRSLVAAFAAFGHPDRNPPLPPPPPPPPATRGVSDVKPPAEAPEQGPRSHHSVDPDEGRYDQLSSAPSTPTRRRLASTSNQLQQPFDQSADMLPGHLNRKDDSPTPTPRPRGASLASNVPDRRNAGWFSMNGTAHHRSSGEPETPSLEEQAVMDWGDVGGEEDVPAKPDVSGDKDPPTVKRRPSYFNSLRRPSRANPNATYAPKVISTPNVNETRKASREEIMHDLFLLNGGKATDALGWAVEDTTTQGGTQSDVSESLADHGSLTASSPRGGRCESVGPSDSSRFVDPPSAATKSSLPDAEVKEDSLTRIRAGSAPHPVGRQLGASALTATPPATRHKRLNSDVTGVAMLGSGPGSLYEKGPYVDPSQEADFDFRPRRLDRKASRPADLQLSAKTGALESFDPPGRSWLLNDSAVEEEDEGETVLDAQIISARRESMNRRASASRSRDMDLRNCIRVPISAVAREVVCRVIESTDPEEIRWEVVLRRKPEASGTPIPNLGKAIDLSGSERSANDVPPSATSINLSLDLEKPTGKLVFVSLPVIGSTPLRTSSASSRFATAADPLDFPTFHPHSPLRQNSSPKRPTFPAYNSAPALKHHVFAIPALPLSPKSLENGFECVNLTKRTSSADLPPQSPKDRSRAHRKVSMQGGVIFDPTAERN